MVRAAARGIVDFRASRFRDPGWWRRIRALLDEMERQDDAEFWRLLVLRHLLIASGSVTRDAFATLQEEAQKAILSYVACLRPWERPDTHVAVRDISDWRDTYRREIGDPSDPAVIKRILDAMHAKAPADQEVPREYLERVHQVMG